MLKGKNNWFVVDSSKLAVKCQSNIMLGEDSNFIYEIPIDKAKITLEPEVTSFILKLNFAVDDIIVIAKS